MGLNRPVCLAAWSLAFWITAAVGEPPRGAPAPWVFRGLLDDKPVIFMILRPDMTLAYDEAGCSLYRAWKGGPRLLDEPAAGSARAYRADGADYHIRRSASPWSVRGPSGNVPVTVRFEGLTGEGGTAGLAPGKPMPGNIIDKQMAVTLNYSLLLPGGGRIRVRETPAFEDHYGDRGIFRRISMFGIPPRLEVRLQLSGKGMPESWGGGANGAPRQEAGVWLLFQAEDGEAPLKVTWSEGHWDGQWK